MNNYKALLIKIFTFLGGLYFVLKFVLPEKNGVIAFKDIHEHVINGFTLLGSLAIGLGILNLIVVHGGKLVYKKSNWIFSAVLLIGLVLMLSVQSIDWYRKQQNGQKASELLMLAEFSKKIVEDSSAEVSAILPRAEREQLLRQAVEKQLLQLSSLASADNDLGAAILRIQKIIAEPLLDNQIHTQLQEQINIGANLYREELDKQNSKRLNSNLSNFLNQGLFVSLGSAMFSLLGFYIAAAAYRAFRVRSVEASLMMLAALIVMLGQIPFGLWISPHFPELRMWLLQVPSAGAARAIEMGAGIAGLILAIRMWLSLESDSFKS